MKWLLLSLLFSAGWRADLPAVLNDYYEVKDALVAGDAAGAARAAGGMLSAINTVDLNSLSARDRRAFTAWRDKLAYDARHISESKDISHQREHFVSLSANLVKLAAESGMSAQPVYEEYCPMRKAYWLSRDTVIRNPYLGSSMLSCGKVTRTLKP
ncbi:MAG TPA: DUF3347 domain-containing protein [Puia sp.]|nr:DUF3347 domain-containing protein [Puia sp.]